MCLFSGQLVEWYPFSLVVTTYTPLSPTRTRLRSEYYLRPRDRRDAPRLCRDRPGRARRSHRRRSHGVRSARARPRRRLRPRRQLAGPVSDADGARPQAVPRLPPPADLAGRLSRLCGFLRGDRRVRPTLPASARRLCRFRRSIRCNRLRLGRAIRRCRLGRTSPALIDLYF